MSPLMIEARPRLEGEVVYQWLASTTAPADVTTFLQHFANGRVEIHVNGNAMAKGIYELLEVRLENDRSTALSTARIRLAYLRTAEPGERHPESTVGAEPAADPLDADTRRLVNWFVGVCPYLLELEVTKPGASEWDAAFRLAKKRAPARARVE